MATGKSRSVVSLLHAVSAQPPTITAPTAPSLQQEAAGTGAALQQGAAGTAAALQQEDTGCGVVLQPETAGTGIALQPVGVIITLGFPERPEQQLLCLFTFIKKPSFS